MQLKQVIGMSDSMTVTEVKSVLSGCARLQFLDAKDKYYQLQVSVYTAVSMIICFAMLCNMMHVFYSSELSS